MYYEIQTIDCGGFPYTEYKDEPEGEWELNKFDESDEVSEAENYDKLCDEFPVDSEWDELDLTEF